ncbi:hypothetical protein B0T10DRAFT_479257 [Thelonectria olida]|uniref:Zn(2)-C6 fungal-type domain-containing protein n=1 Tax=Thelonectria olida TaxID=1576542 RepID=A0A9P8WDQ3_9HYPO|nr:hypothetical protein B0T10DRAFT_479257 [Thelonectria olida]
MARLGSTKVKTGCKTCKIRKVKCDETWPQCQRCQKTGRTCDGYQAPPTGSLSWDLLLRPQPSTTPARDSHELRSLAFFHQVVAPVLSGPFDPSFWTHLVAQATHHEPATRHAVLAISSFFETFSETTCVAADNPFAIQHYNRAIKRLLTEPMHDVDSVLTVCVLFICIEFLRGDKEAAINHTRHGIRLLSTKRGPSQLTPVFCYIHLFPLFFGATVTEIPLMVDGPGPGSTFQSMLEAKHSLDVIMARTVWLVRRTEGWQIGATPEEENGPTPAMFEEQRELAESYRAWDGSFARFQARQGTETKKDAASLALRIRWLTCSIWVDNCLKKGEMMYDAYREQGKSMVEMARCALALDEKAGRRKKFMFDMGFSPILHFLALKCRYLHTRVAALALLKGLACPRESLWDAVAMQAVGRKVIEVEHDIELRPEAVRVDNEFSDDEAGLPPEKDRIRGYVLLDRDDFRAKEGVSVYQRPVCLLAFGEDGGLARRHEWVTVYT